MSKPRVICLGEILFDLLANQIGKSLTEVESWTPYPGGAPANVACALVKLGTPAAFVGCVGKDSAGEELLTLCKDIGVDISGVQRHATAPTRQVYVLRSATGDRQFAGFGEQAPDCFADAFLQANQLPEDLFTEAEFLVLGTLELAYPQTREAIFQALSFAERYDLKVMLDVNWRPMFWEDVSQAQPLIQQLWKQIDFLKLAQEEAQWLFDTDDAGAIAYRLDSVEGVIVTNGNQSLTYCVSENEGSMTPFSMNVQDTTGAGDGFVAGLVHQFYQQGIKALKDPEKVKEIVTYACAVGGLIATKPGAIASQPTAAEVEAFLQSKGG